MTEEEIVKLREFIPSLKKFGIDEHFKWNPVEIDEQRMKKDWDFILDELDFLITITDYHATFASMCGLGFSLYQDKFVVIPYEDDMYEFQPKFHVFDRIINLGEVFDLFFAHFPDYGHPLTSTPIFDRLETQDINSDYYPNLDKLFKNYLVNYPFDPNFF